MEKRILFILEKSSMVANALIRGLEEASFTVVRTRPDVAEISRVEDRPEIWLFFLQGADNPLMTDVLFYIREQVEEHGVRLFAVGTPRELDEMLWGLPADSLAGTFARPFLMNELIERCTMEATEAAEEPPAERRRVLVVDDDTVMLQSLKELLSSSYRVYTANSGMNAIQMLVNTEVDLILLDYEMPVVKGPQVFEMLQSEPHTKDIPVMFLTAKNDKESIMTVLNLGPVNYLLKSLPQAEILERIHAFFEGDRRDNGARL